MFAAENAADEGHTVLRPDTPAANGADRADGPSEAPVEAAPITRTCAHCGESFKPARAWQKYCSPACRSRATATKARAKRADREVPDDRPVEPPEPALPDLETDLLPDDPTLDPERPLYAPTRSEKPWLSARLKPPPAGPWESDP